MTYSTLVPEARFSVGSVEEGTCIHSWWRQVEPDYVQFTAQCGPNDGSGSCALCWKQSADESGQLVLTYTCDDIDCAGMKKSKGSTGGSECILEYSFDGRTYYPVDENPPGPDVNCFFRCRCAAGEKSKGKAKTKSKSKPKKARSKKAKSKKR
jgi:hypothetical protein